jgi:hypothetical protein
MAASYHDKATHRCCSCGDGLSLRELRMFVFERDGGCVWPGCVLEVSGVNPLQLAHLEHRGMGGSKTRDTAENTVTLCKAHHDCLDGRTSLGTLRYELNLMLKHVTHR